MIMNVLNFELKGEGESPIPTEEIPEALKMLKRISPSLYRPALEIFKNTEIKGMEDVVVLLTNLHVKLHLIKSKID